MPTSPLPPNASLEHLKGQAKLIRDLVRSSEGGALAMIDEFHPRMNTADLDEDALAKFKLSDAQLIVARMHRCASWPKLREHVRVVLESLLELGLDIDARTGGSGTTALHDAAQANDVDRAQMLIAHGADPNLVDHHIGANPWAWADHFHHEDVAAYLYPLTEHESGDTSS